MLEKARREKKMAEKKLVAATESDSEHSYKPSRTATKLDFEDLGASAQFSSDEDSYTIESRKKKKKRKQKEKKLSAASASTSLQSAPVPRTAKQGKTGNGSDGEKLLSVADWAKLCPVKYASSCTAKNINLAMWVWGKLAEIRAALAGSISPLAKGELEARLRHMQCVLEVCNQNSAPTDYTPYGWRLARNYDSRVQAMIDTEVSDWVSFNACFNILHSSCQR